jgi:Flp pilus assembly protein TadG
MKKRRIDTQGACRSRDSREGAILPLAVILLTVMIAMLAFVIDIGRIVQAQAELQTAADASALAGAQALNDGPAQCKNLARDAGQDNHALQNAVSIVTGEDVELGLWNKNTQTFTVLAGTNEANANAVRVTCRCTDARGNAASLFFGPILGTSKVDVMQSSIAYAGLIFCGPFIGIDKISMSGSSYTDSYNSSEGPYVANVARDKGSLCSDGPITMSGSTGVKGDAFYGEGFSLSSSSSGVVTGMTAERTGALSLPPVDFGDAATANNNANIPLSDNGENPLSATGDFSLSGGDHVALQAGTYYFKKLSLSGGSSITITGETALYCTGDVNISGGSIANSTQLPKNLEIYCTGKNCNISGSSNFFGMVYAPTSDITRSADSHFYGLLVGKKLTLSGNGGLHADESITKFSGVRPRAYLVQ